MPPTDSEHITVVTQLWCEIFDNEETWLTTSVCVTIQRASNLTQCHFLRRHDCLAVVAQTKVGFSQEVVGRNFGNSLKKRGVHRKAYARARKMCVIFFLRHKGLNWCCDRYGQPHVWCRPLLAWHNQCLRGSSPEDCPGDNQFISSLDLTDVPGGTMAQRRYPPVDRMCR